MICPYQLEPFQLDQQCICSQTTCVTNNFYHALGLYLPTERNMVWFAAKRSTSSGIPGTSLIKPVTSLELHNVDRIVG